MGNLSFGAGRKRRENVGWWLALSGNSFKSPIA
jgi:hypothetical protein